MRPSPPPFRKLSPGDAEASPSSSRKSWQMRGSNRKPSPRAATPAEPSTRRHTIPSDISSLRSWRTRELLRTSVRSWQATRTQKAMAATLTPKSKPCGKRCPHFPIPPMQTDDNAKTDHVNDEVTRETHHDFTASRQTRRI